MCLHPIIALQRRDDQAMRRAEKDWRARHAEYIGTLPDETIAEVLAKLNALLA